ncbi:MAG: hypothetical protein AAGJ46_07845 [Planctomycetota bacterium]
MIYALLVGVASPPACASGFASIEYWVGQGSNEAALAIDWDGDSTSDTALVWGYRWDGDALGEQMLRDIVAADSRLFARVGSIGSFGLAVFGLGYDDNDDGQFAIDQPGVFFGPDGLAVTGPDDGGEAIDSADRYREGWFEYYWHYGSGSESNGVIAWQTSQTGLATSVLVDGQWNSLAFASAIPASFTEFAENLLPAQPPTVALPGDLNSDGRVDAADYTAWRDGAAPIADYLLWKQHFGQSSAGAAASHAESVVPEPHAACVLLLAAFAVRARRPPQR